METISIKERFLEDNTDFKEIKPTQELTTIGGFPGIDEVEDEVWFLQCPKGFDVESELQGQKFKIPGRTNFNSCEAVAVEYAEPETRAFGYCNRKGRYSLRLLPVKGNILLRGRLKATEAVTLENAEAMCPPQGRVPFPEMIKVRHPLHGHQFDKSIRVNKDIAERLKKADEISAKVLYDAIKNRNIIKNVNSGLSKMKQRPKAFTTNEQNAIQIDSTDEDGVFEREEKTKKRKKSRKNSESIVTGEEEGLKSTNEVAKKQKKSHKTSIGEVSKDLQWLQNI
ncbi:PREDICTED: uncharacterized protein LOC108363367 [Rhagoletis zephyria]|uniref:uncharacterized protein LOC108363367 n=1 Tax=Rhagoletis zephyria TaxID=28612 RepID=UPI000811995A|nr:PREDICTED: uncharacterized protein LOC108363367 [Rhagoletis zephyria]